MIDFTAVNRYEVTMDALVQAWTIEDLRALTIQSVERFLTLLARCTDESIGFVPDDPEAHDEFAARFRPEEAAIGWTIGHNIVHATASAEEYAYDAAGLARGVPYNGRSRIETPWQSIKRKAHCVQRLNESRRMRLASLDLWPDRPDLINGVTPWRESGWVNAVGLFAWGLAHDAAHLAQIEKILGQIE